MPILTASKPFEYSPEIERIVSQIAEMLKGTYQLSHRTVAILVLQYDKDANDWVKQSENEEVYDSITKLVIQAEKELKEPIGYRIALERQAVSSALAGEFLRQDIRHYNRFLQFTGRLCMHPIWGIPILFVVLYFGLYKFVGVFAGGLVVDYINSVVFGNHINPFVTHWTNAIIPYEPIRQLLVGEYGIWTFGVTYAFALVLPIVGFFFLVFALLEDSGYLPRLALLVDRLFKQIGLNGRAVIPIVLGFGCDTTATIVTRILETKRERIIATFLLSLVIPCSAQLGVILALLADHQSALWVWGLILTGVFLLAGFLAGRLTPGKAPGFYMEIPPMRMPSFSNVMIKTISRLQWYFMEVLPIFIYASILIWVGQLTHLFDLAIRCIKPIVQAMGLPAEASTAFLFGFFRRDYGAAGLYSLHGAHQLNGNQLLIAAVVLTLFLPCIAQFIIIQRERGLRMALGVACFTAFFAISVGIILNQIILRLGMHL
ncbi:MAG: ferrous iron transporter B [bacterium]